MKKLIPLFFLVSVCMLFSSCTEKVPGYTVDANGNLKNDSATAVAIILGRHANAMAIPSDAYRAIDSVLDDAVYGGYVCAIISDGAPSKIELTDNNEDFFIENAKNGNVLKSRIEERSQEIRNRLNDESLSARTAESDLLAAIREAKTALSTSWLSEVKNKEIIIVDTGISTTGDLNLLTMDGFEIKPDITQIVTYLKNSQGVGSLPDLTGIKVTFIGTDGGMAEVAAPQKLSTSDKKYIRDLWVALVSTCGAEVAFESSAGWSTPNIYSEDKLIGDTDWFPNVTTVVFGRNEQLELIPITVDVSDSGDDQPNLPAPPDFTVKLDNETIAFKPDSADYLNEANTLAKLKPYANRINQYAINYPTAKIWLFGTTATTTRYGDGDANLAQHRADKVKETLVTMFNVPEEILFTIGLGAKFPWHVDEFSSGEFDTNIAQANRAVWLLTNGSENEEFQLLRDAYNSNNLLPEAMTQLNGFLQ